MKKAMGNTMPDVQMAAAFGKRFSDGFAETMNQEKNNRIARDSIRDLMLFNNALESEIQKITSAMDSGKAFDQKMLDYLSSVKEKYNYAMTGFKAFDDEMERFALMSLADAIQDLMSYVHNRKKH